MVLFSKRIEKVWYCHDLTSCETFCTFWGKITRVFETDFILAGCFKERMELESWGKTLRTRGDIKQNAAFLMTVLGTDELEKGGTGQLISYRHFKFWFVFLSYKMILSSSSLLLSSSSSPLWNINLRQPADPSWAGQHPHILFLKRRYNSILTSKPRSVPRFISRSDF